MRKIKVNEKNLIDRMNENIKSKEYEEANTSGMVLDNHGPVQSNEEPYEAKDDGINECCYNKVKDVSESRIAAIKGDDMKYINTMNKVLKKEKEDTQLRTQEKSEEEYEYVNHPKHYNNYDVEVIDMMERIFGIWPTYHFCKLNAYKYRMRAGTKPNISFQQDLDKEKWYLSKAKELKAKIPALTNPEDKNK